METQTKKAKTLLIKYEEDGISSQENYPIEIINDIKTNSNTKEQRNHNTM